MHARKSDSMAQIHDEGFINFPNRETKWPGSTPQYAWILSVSRFPSSCVRSLLHYSLSFLLLPLLPAFLLSICSSIMATHPAFPSYSGPVPAIHA